MDIKRKIREFMLSEFKNVGFNENILDDESLVNADILDSLSVLKLISFLDEEFKIELEEDELNPERLDSIDKIASLIKKKYPEL